MSFVTGPLPRSDSDFLITEIETQFERASQAVSDLNRGRVWRTAVPASSSASGRVGQIAIDTTHLYVCVDTDTWRRVALSTW